jgi:quercetin dioxygenase-like cupin family protein
MTASGGTEGTGTRKGPPRPVQVLTRSELISRAVNDLPGAERGGFLRTAFPGLAAATFRSTLVVMPLGQRSPPRESEIEHIIVVLEGSFLFRIDGADYEVGELDQILVPVGVDWEYQNTALGQSTYLSIVGP